MNRDDPRQPNFPDEVDRQCFLETDGKTCAWTDWQVPGPCLMGSHFICWSRRPKRIWSRARSGRWARTWGDFTGDPSFPLICRASYVTSNERVTWQGRVVTGAIYDAECQKSGPIPEMAPSRPVGPSLQMSGLSVLFNDSVFPRDRISLVKSNRGSVEGGSLVLAEHSHDPT